MGRGSALELQCGCGQVQLELSAPGAASATRLRCYCTDCQAAARHLGYALPAHGGTDLIQTTPDRLRIVQGQEHLAILRLGPKGLCRWYATCCNTPMMNMLPKQGLPFAGVVVHALETVAADAAVGLVWGHAFTQSAMPGQGSPAKDAHFAGIGMGIVKRMLGAYLTGRNRINPFLTETRDWIAPIRVLTKAERDAATTGR